MDDNVIRSMIKWPDIPDVYGWLRLDRRGNWRIRMGAETALSDFQPIGNAAFRQFIGRNYAADERGCWFFQNGPQRVFVGLAYTPFVFRKEGTALIDQCGRSADKIESVWLDEEGSLILNSSRGPGVLDDRDLGEVAEGVSRGLFQCGATNLPVGDLAGREIETLFGFVMEPAP
jgi:hypothetical protein